MKKIILIIPFYLFFFSSCIFAQDAHIVGIAGGTGSGKTTFANKIRDALGNHTVLISQDCYYKDLGHLPMEAREKVNFDHPQALDFPLLKKHLLALKNRETIEKPVYNFKTHLGEPFSVTIQPQNIILVEGILILAVPEIRDLLDLKIYVDNQDDIRILRRIGRDIQERGRDFEQIKEQYISTVKPMHTRFVEPSKWHADVIIPSAGDNQTGVDLIISKLLSLQ